MTLSGYEYTCSAGETFDSIALEIYGDEKYAAEMLCVNPQYSSKLAFTGGEILSLPVIEIAEDEDTGEQIGPAPWKE